MIGKYIATVSILLFGAGAMAEQGRAMLNCRVDRGSGPCLEALSRGKGDLYDVRTLDAHRAAGDQVRRVFYDDGYGRDLILIAFVRAPGANPILSVHFPRRRDGRIPEPLVAALPTEAWRAALLRQVDFDRDPMLAPSARDPSILCMHGWTYLIEATDPARGREAAAERRLVENACDVGPASRYAAEVQRAALPFFPYCARLDPRQHRNHALRLAACALLRGDRMAAADVMNLAAPFLTISGSWDATRLAGTFTARSRIDWNGERNPPGGDVAAFWASRATPEIGVTSMHFVSVEGEGGRRVRLTATLSKSVNTPRGRATGTERARVEQIWVREPVGAFRVESATVGPWEPYPPR